MLTRLNRVRLASQSAVKTAWFRHGIFGRYVRSAVGRLFEIVAIVTAVIALLQYESFQQIDDADYAFCKVNDKYYFLKNLIEHNNQNLNLLVRQSKGVCFDEDSKRMVNSYR